MSIASFDLRQRITRAEHAILAYVKLRYPNAREFSFGAVHLDPAHLAIWITVDRDEERDKLSNDRETIPAFRRLLAEAGYPQEAVPAVKFAFESQETVNRDYGGSWWACVK